MGGKNTDSGMPWIDDEYEKNVSLCNTYDECPNPK